MQRHEAEENLRVIRSLMEKATIYRAISAPTALVGGIAATAVGSVLGATSSSDRENTMPMLFFIAWLCVLVVTGASNAYFIRRDAHRRGEKFVSPGMKMALLALLPSHLVAGVATVISFALLNHRYLGGMYLMLPYFWCTLYGMGLIAMNHFAPGSIVRLGWAFLFVGLLLIANAFLGFTELFSGGERQAHLIMASTFGLFHLVYAALTWPRGAATARSN